MSDVTKIGNIQLKNPFILAPMAGYTDLTFREICVSFGAAMTVSEMVSAKGLCYGDSKSMALLEKTPGDAPTAFQIFGSEPDIMRRAAEMLDDQPNEILDINMGCPVPKVVKNGDGSALLKDPDRIYEIVKAVTSAISKPLTVKIRIGISGAPENAHILAAKAVEAGGAAALAVHGRTREQYYSGTADLNAIKRIKQAVSIPVIGNGDVSSFDDADKMMKFTGCDFVMIGRGALGNPWIFKELADGAKGNRLTGPPSLEERKRMIIDHYLAMEKNKGEYVSVREMRKFAGKYLKGVSNSSFIRGKINTVDNGKEFCRLIESLI